MKKTILVTNNLQLHHLVEEEIKLNGPNCDLNHLDVSNVTDMGWLFQGSDFNGDISHWNTSNVLKMTGLFKQSQFNGDISRWNTSHVIIMNRLFSHSQFNGDISGWDTSKAQNMSSMFANSQFDGDISNWNTTNVKDMEYIFDNCPAIVPYWAKYKDIEQRKIAIAEYHTALQEKKQLMHNLSESSKACFNQIINKI